MASVSTPRSRGRLKASQRSSQHRQENILCAGFDFGDGPGLACLCASRVTSHKALVYMNPKSAKNEVEIKRA
jgi:hypothetical protein